MELMFRKIVILRNIRQHGYQLEIISLQSSESLNRIKSRLSKFSDMRFCSVFKKVDNRVLGVDISLFAVKDITKSSNYIDVDHINVDIIMLLHSIYVG